MVKPRKKRNVLYPPWMHSFKPHGLSPIRNGDVVILTIDEYESIRLADSENLKQEEAAKKMNISRPTFTRLVDGARKKIADAMVNGKTMKIEGGSFIFLRKRLVCMSCGNIWDTGKEINTRRSCPACKSQKIEDMGKRFGRGRGRRHGPGGYPGEPGR